MRAICDHRCSEEGLARASDRGDDGGAFYGVLDARGSNRFDSELFVNPRRDRAALFLIATEKSNLFQRTDGRDGCGLWKRLTSSADDGGYICAGSRQALRRDAGHRARANLAEGQRFDDGFERAVRAVVEHEQRHCATFSVGPRLRGRRAGSDSSECVQSSAFPRDDCLLQILRLASRLGRKGYFDRADRVGEVHD